MRQLSDTTLTAALAWYDAGCSLVPIAADGQKKAAVKWTHLQHQRVTRQQVETWYNTGNYGIGVICGTVSGGLEMLELEGRAADGDSITAVLGACHERGVGDLFEQLMGDGYAEWTPSAGLHFFYRIIDPPTPFPRNEKIARRPATAEELADNPDNPIRVKAETRGEGGYTVVAPTGGACHPSGEGWTVAAGTIGHIPTITWAQRQLLHEAFHAALDEMPPAPPAPPVRPPAAMVLGEAAAGRPGADFNARAEWEDIIGPHGWRVNAVKPTHTEWTRPGKDLSEGISATTGLKGTGDQDRLYVFSTSTVFQTEVPYSKFAAYTLLEHNGDFRAAARELGRRGYGQPLQPSRPRTSVSSSMVVASPQPATTLASPPQPATTTIDVRRAQPVTWRHPWRPVAIDSEVFGHTTHDYRGVADVYATAYEDTFKYVAATKSWMLWNGTVWEQDEKECAEQGAQLLLDAAYDEASRKAAAEEPGGKELAKWVQKMRREKSPAITRWARSDPRIAAAVGEFDATPSLVTVDNGVIDLDGLHFQDHHDPKMMLTKRLRVRYDKDAAAPQWEAFLNRTIPDPATRDYLQRAAGMSLTGECGERALFLLHGMSGTGKSQFIKTLELMFGDYAETAQNTTFNEMSRKATITNDLNDLKGKRFVSLSELNEDEQLNESLIKRLTGGDTAKSRGLYKENKQWRVTFTLWMATNHLPKLSSDDNAIWKRVKPIRFGTEVAQADVVKNLGEKLFREEGPGILNWLLEGVRRYREHGLEDPPSVTDEVRDYRQKVDNVAQFVDAQLEAGRLVEAEGEKIPAMRLHTMYVEWCKESGIKNHYGLTRFGKRMEALESVRVQRRREGAAVMWRGLGQRLATWTAT